MNFISPAGTGMVHDLPVPEGDGESGEYVVIPVIPCTNNARIVLEESVIAGITFEEGTDIISPVLRRYVSPLISTLVAERGC